MVSDRVKQIGLSPTLRINAMATRMRADGEDVLDFSAGQPDFPTPEPIKQAGKRAIDEDRTRYTANNGLIELRRQIADHLREHRGLRYDPEQIVVSTGAKASLYFACMALIDPGDDVLVPSPYWVSYPEQVRLCQGRPVEVPCAEADGFKLTVDALARARTPRTRVLMLNYPSNPTGACYSEAELEPLARFCVEHDIWILADEIYCRLLYDGRRFRSVAAIGPAIQARTIVIDGMSKAYSMTGWRIGYAAGPGEVIDGMARVQSHSTSNATSISQWASVEALSGTQDEVERRAAEMQRRRDEIVERLRALPGVRCVRPEGSFYVFPNVSGCFGATIDGARIDSGEALATYLLDRAKVAVVPGEAFGSPDHVRLSFAASIERIRQGMDRIAEALSALAAA